MQATGQASALIQRWQTLRMHVRCGLSTAHPGCVRLYLHMGLQLARQGRRPAMTVHLQMLQTLLQASRDEALPWFWRSVCLEHVTLPLAHLNTLIGVHDPIALHAIEAAVQRARDELPNLPTLPTERELP